MGGPDVCAFCGASGDEAQVVVSERLGVEVAVCAACREKFAPRPAVRPVPVPVEGGDLPPTLGQQTSAVLEHVRRLQRRAEQRPYAEEDCPSCGHPVHRYPGADGDPVRLAREPVLAGSVPAADRWRVRDGRAVPATDAQDDAQDGEGGEDGEDALGARVLHDVVCPAHPVPDNPRLARLWHAHVRPPAGDV
ncbi:DUF6083 domain-containing protein [Kineococcus sp. LSe6-4]|uniref:DUF6083 domain-containing protein n=1 Tax=Kineococcus halophytocola TaxID=3234027 RepID=A0ABV4GZS7_9ACTN